MNNEIIKKAALQLNLPPKYVWGVYKAYWMAINHLISELPLKEDITKEEFDKIKTSVNIPSLGKFYVDWEHLQSKKREHERYKRKSN